MPLSHTYILYIDDPSCAKDISLDDRFTFKLLRPSLYPVWEQCVLPFQARRDKLDILHCPGNTAPILRLKDIPIVLSLHDTIFLESNAYQRALTSRQLWQERYYRFFSPLSARAATTIITVSRYSQRQIMHRLPGLGCKVVAIHSGPTAFQRESTEQPPSSSRGRARTHPFIFALGAANPRKNTELVMQAYAKYIKFGHNEKLVIAGLDDPTIAKLRALASALAISEQTALLGFVDEVELAGLYEQASMFVFPSLAEGFGFPPLEAMSHGAVVMASHAGAVPEVVGDAAVLFDPNDANALAKKMSALSMDPERRSELRRLGYIRVNSFSWEETANRTLEVYTLSTQHVTKSRNSDPTS